MNELTEGMAFQLPAGDFDLHETRSSPCDAALHARSLTGVISNVARLGGCQRLTGGPKALDRTAEV